VFIICHAIFAFSGDVARPAAGTIWLALEANAPDFPGKQDFGMCESQICKMVPPRRSGAASSVRRMVVNQLDLRCFSDVFTFCAASENPRRRGKASLRQAFLEIDALLDAHVLSDRPPFSKS
jgi:hypothetical protein